MKSLVLRYMSETKAVSALEYAILAGVVIVAVAAALGLFVDELEDALLAIGTNIEDTAGDIGK